MKSLLCALAVLAAAIPLSGAAQDDLLARMNAVNANLHSYSASMKAHVAMTTFPYISTDLNGTYYHKDPDRDKLEITSGLPGLAQQFSELYPRLVPPSQWNQVFTVTKVSDDGTTTHFKLVPRKQGNVDHIDANVDDKRATVTAMTWAYANGGTAEMTNSYSDVKGYVLVTSQTGRVDEPQYKGTITSTLSNYQINPNIPDSTFAQSGT
jgi:outer membrane lipoprotein-sorting protein